MAGGALHQPAQDLGVEMGKVARKGDHRVVPGDFEGGKQAAKWALAGQQVGVDGHADVRIQAGMRSDDIDVVPDPLQNLHLANDDGAAFDDQTALIATTKTTGAASRKNGGGRRRGDHGRLMMTEARVGRLLAASLHQAIFDRLPQRLEFYEHWLHSEGLRDGSIGLSPMIAVLGFLRTEGDAYDAVMSRAGQLAAQWTVESLPSVQRRAIAWLPRPFRARAALGIARTVLASICSATKASTRVRRKTADVTVRGSLFCDVREHQRLPLCAFYRAATVAALGALAVPAIGQVSACHAVGDGPCVIALQLFGAQAEAGPAMAA